MILIFCLIALLFLFIVGSHDFELVCKSLPEILSVPYLFLLKLRHFGLKVPFHFFLFLQSSFVVLYLLFQLGTPFPPVLNYLRMYFSQFPVFFDLSLLSLSFHVCFSKGLLDFSLLLL